jgi:hypothetical protein
MASTTEPFRADWGRIVLATAVRTWSVIGGQLLLPMHRREFEATLLEAKAGLARSRISSEDALRELTRTQELLERAYEQVAQFQRSRRTKATESIQRRSAGS